MSVLEWSELTHERPGKIRRSECCRGCRRGAWRAESWAQWLCRPHGQWPIGTCETGQWISAVAWEGSGRNLLSKWTARLSVCLVLPSVCELNYIITVREKCQVAFVFQTQSVHFCMPNLLWRQFTGHVSVIRRIGIIFRRQCMASEWYFLIHNDLLTHYTNCYGVVAL
jgi:hypothetical protein